MIIHTTKERGSSILSYHLDQQMGSTWVFVDEGAHIMNESRYKDQMTFLRLLLDYKKRQERKRLATAK